MCLEVHRVKQKKSPQKIDITSLPVLVSDIWFDKSNPTQNMTRIDLMGAFVKNMTSVQKMQITKELKD